MKDFFCQLSKVNCQRSNKRGFTLIELLVVIVIIAALATLLTANFLGVRQRGRDALRKSDLRSIQSALELYRSDNGFYPATSTNPIRTCGASFPASGNTIYMKKIPCDPATPTQYYVYTANPSSPACDNSTTYCISYTIYTCIENSKDPDSDANQGRTPAVQGSCTTSYTITNP